MSGFSSFLANLDQEHDFPAGTLEGQEQIESGGNPNAVSPTGAEGLFQIEPATAADPGYGIAPISNPDDPYQAATFAADYDSAMEDQTGSLGGGLAAYNEGLGNYQSQGIGGASSAYQSLIASLGLGSAPGATAANPSGSSFTSNGDNTGWQTLPGQGGATSSSATPEQLGSFISGWLIRLLIGVGGLIAIAVALSMFKQTAPIVTAVTAPVKKVAKGAAIAAAA